MCTHALAALLSSVFCFTLAIFVLLKNPRSKLNVVYFYLELLLAVWTFSSFLTWYITNLRIVVIANKVNYIFAVYQPVLFAHLFYTFLNYKNRYVLLRMGYIISTVLSILSPTTLFIKGIISAKPFLPFLPQPGILFSAFIVYQYIFCLFVYSDGLKKYVSLEAGSQKTKLFYLMCGTFVGFIGFTLFMLIVYRVNTFFVHVPHDLFIIAYSAIIAYAIVRHKLMEIDVIIKKTFVFAALFAGAYAIIAMCTFLSQFLFENIVSQNKWVALVPSIAIIVIMLRPLENLLLRLTDKYLFQKKYDYKNLLKTFSKEVLTVLDIKKLVTTTVEQLVSIIRIRSCGVLLYIKVTDVYEMYASVGLKENKYVYYCTAGKKEIPISTSRYR